MYPFLLFLLFGSGIFCFSLSCLRNKYPGIPPLFLFLLFGVGSFYILLLCLWKKYEGMTEATDGYITESIVITFFILLNITLVLIYVMYLYLKHWSDVSDAKRKLDYYFIRILNINKTLSGMMLLFFIEADRFMFPTPIHKNTRFLLCISVFILSTTGECFNLLAWAERYLVSRESASQPSKCMLREKQLKMLIFVAFIFQFSILASCTVMFLEHFDAINYIWVMIAITSLGMIELYIQWLCLLLAKRIFFGGNHDKYPRSRYAIRIYGIFLSVSIWILLVFRLSMKPEIDNGYRSEGYKDEQDGLDVSVIVLLVLKMSCGLLLFPNDYIKTVS